MLQLKILGNVSDHCAASRFTALHAFEKPNDERGLALMDHAAVVSSHWRLHYDRPGALFTAVDGGSAASPWLPQEVMREFPDIRLAFGESEEYSFIFHKSSRLYGTSAVTSGCLRSGRLYLRAATLPRR